MASDTKKKNNGTKKKASTTTKTTKAAAKKKTTSTKTKSAATVKTTAKKASTNAKKTPVTSKKKTTVKKASVPKIEREDLEEREPDLAKTVVINPQIVEELRIKEKDTVEDIKIAKSKKKPEHAKTILGLDLPSNMTKEDRATRKKFYAKDALIFAIIIPILDLFAMMFIDSYTYLMITNSVPLNYLITLLVDFVLIFIVTYIIDYVFGEDSVKRINK